MGAVGEGIHLLQRLTTIRGIRLDPPGRGSDPEAYHLATSGTRVMHDHRVSRRAFFASSSLAIIGTCPRPAVAAAVYRPIILRGDYAGNGASGHERQESAKREGCICVVEFHFNSDSDSKARGGETHFQKGVPDSLKFADAMWAEIASTGLPSHGTEPVKSTAVAKRSAFIDRYEMPAILLEPLFVSNPGQAKWIHDPKNVGNLASVISAGIKGQFPKGGRVGLSPGHAYKTNTPEDKGAKCALGDHEVDHVLALVEQVEKLLGKA
jgi:N-acetylmuramoyl-L-alanine amidase